MSIFLVNNAPEPKDNLLNEAFEYLKGCLEGAYEIDEKLLEACIDIINENTDNITVDDYNVVMESVDYLHEISAKKLANKLAKEELKMIRNRNTIGRAIGDHPEYGKEYEDDLKDINHYNLNKINPLTDSNERAKLIAKVKGDKNRFKDMLKSMKKANKLAKKSEKANTKLGKHIYKNDMI